MTWTKQDDSTWTTTIGGHLVKVLKAGLTTRPVYDLYVDGQAVRRCPKLNEAKAFAGPYVARMSGKGEPAPKAPRALVGAAAAARAKAAERGTEGNGKAKEAKPCLCGCGESTGGGTFRAGHDARYKSTLIREAMAGNEEATATLEARGWTKFLDKARVVAERATVPDATRVARKERLDVEAEAAAGAMRRIDAMKRARLVLIAIGRYSKSAGERQISMEAPVVDGKININGRLEVAESILDGSHPEMDDAEAAIARRIAKESV